MALATAVSLNNSKRIFPEQHSLECLDDEDEEVRAHEQQRTMVHVKKQQQYTLARTNPSRRTRRSSIREEVQRVRLRLSNKQALEPQSKYMRRWDGVTFAALIFTAVVTPVEVAFTNSGRIKSHEIPIFVINRVVDAVFLTDMVMQFFVAYHTKSGILVKSRRLIAIRYLRGWFAIDCISSLPFDLLTFYVDGLSILKSLRLLRLLKLARIIRASRILARWEEAAIFAFSYAEISMYKFFVKLLLYAHWNACIWGVVAHRDITDGWTWMSALEIAQSEPRGVYECTPEACVEKVYMHFDKSIVMHKYWASLYFAVYTMTGIGYGDITAVRHSEVVVATLIMLSGAVFWAFMIGEFVTLVSHMDVYGNAFRQRMDEFNYMMKDMRFPVHLRRRCRLFLLHSRQHHRKLNYRQLEKSMSISLRYEVANANNAWIAKVWFFRGVSPPFLVELSQSAHSLVYAPMEVVEQALTLCVVNNGIGARKGRIMTKGSVWGHDFMLENLDFVDMAFTAALSYLEVVGLSRDKMNKLLESPIYEMERRLVRKAVVFYTFKAHTLRVGAAIVNKLRRTDDMNSSWDALLSKGDDNDLDSPDQRRRRSTLTAVNGLSTTATSKEQVLNKQLSARMLQAARVDDDGLPSSSSSSDDDGIQAIEPVRTHSTPTMSPAGFSSSDLVKLVNTHNTKLAVKFRKLEGKVTMQYDRMLRLESKLTNKIDDLSHRIITLGDRLPPPGEATSNAGDTFGNQHSPGARRTFRR